MTHLLEPLGQPDLLQAVCQAVFRRVALRPGQVYRPVRAHEAVEAGPLLQGAGVPYRSPDPLLDQTNVTTYNYIIVFVEYRRDTGCAQT